MSCKVTSDNLIAFLHGELTTKETHIIEIHISTCRYCQSQLQELNQLKLIWNNPIQHLNDSFTDKIMDNITKAGDVKTRRWYLKSELMHFSLAATATITLFTTGAFEHYSFFLNEYAVNLAKGTNEFYLLFIKGSLWLDSLQFQITSSLQLF